MCSPNDAYAIIKALKENRQDPGGVPHPLHLGLRLHELLKGHRSGRGRAGHLPEPLCAADSQPAIEPLLVAVEQTDRESDMDLAGLIEIGYDLEKVAKKYRDLLDTSKMAQIDTGVLLHQIPGACTPTW